VSEGTPNRKQQSIVGKENAVTRIEAETIERAGGGELPADQRMTIRPDRVNAAQKQTAQPAVKAYRESEAGAASDVVDARRDNMKPNLELAGPSPVQERPHVSAEADGPVQSSPARRKDTARNAGFVPRSPAELWPEIFGQGAQAEPPSRPEDRAGRGAESTQFPDVARRETVRSSDSGKVWTRSVSGHWFPQVPIPASARPMPSRLPQVATVEERMPDEMRELWPELPQLQEYGAVETERAMRNWERAARLDREQRGEF
jgi:hypothetical protein